ncbi:unnamed protein product [Ixodes pacificus]
MLRTNVYKPHIWGQNIRHTQYIFITNILLPYKRLAPRTCFDTRLLEPKNFSASK